MVDLQPDITDAQDILATRYQKTPADLRNLSHLLTGQIENLLPYAETDAERAAIRLALRTMKAVYRMANQRGSK